MSFMVQIIEVHEALKLSDYEAYAFLAPAVSELRREAETLVPELKGRTVWMVNSTAQGGGVAEMLPKMVTMMRELGIDVRWEVIGSSRPEFFVLTKRLHNLIHGVGDPNLGEEDRALYDAVSRENAQQLRALVKPRDVLVIHDPQPLGAGALVREEMAVPSIWRCHIGLDQKNAATRAAWSFLEPWLSGFDLAIFSAPEYIPDFLAGQARVIHPAIDPLSHKNRDLSPHKLQGILCNSRLAVENAPVLTAPFAHMARRLSPDGAWLPATEPEGLGLLYRPTIVQISRWDRLKGFGPLLDGFVRLKQKADQPGVSEVHRRRLKILRLILAGPDPSSVADDPEGLEVIGELTAKYQALDPEMQADVAMISLPMESRKENALMVNALQRCATIVVQNSIQEGFGLTVSEAMWKRSPVLGSSACGIRQQIRDGIDGRLIHDPTDPEEIASTLDEMLIDPGAREMFASHAQRRVHAEFLIFSQLRAWIRTLVEVVASRQ